MPVLDRDQIIDTAGDGDWLIDSDAYQNELKILDEIAEYHAGSTEESTKGSQISGQPIHPNQQAIVAGIKARIAEKQKQEENIEVKGGPGSGHFGHSGRPGKVGGSVTDPLWLPGMKPIHPNKQIKLDKLAEEAKRKAEERAWHEVIWGASPRNSLRSSTLAEAETELQEDNGYKIRFGYDLDQDRSAGRTFLLEMTGAEKVWYGEGYGSRALHLMDKEGHDLLVGMDVDYSRVVVHHIFKSHKGGMLGVKFMRAMKRYADITGKELRVGLVANKDYFRGFPWLQETPDHDFIYKPSEKIKLKGGSGSGNFAHAGRPGKRGGSAPNKSGKLPGNIVSTAQANPAFRAWFKDSKIVDAQGRPMVVYHGTPSKPSEAHSNFYNQEEIRASGQDTEYPEFEVFNTESYGITDSGWLGRGTYFTPDAEFAFEFGDKIMPVFLSVKKPFVIEDDSSNGATNIYRFRESLAKLDLPEDLAWIKPDLTLPKDFEAVDYKGELRHHIFEASESTNEKGIKNWVVIEYVPRSGHEKNKKEWWGGIEAEGASRNEAISNYNDKVKGWEHTSKISGFVSTLISNEIYASRFTKILKQNGYDGVVSRSPGRGVISEILAFYPTQIKSAIGNQGTFDPKNPSILKERLEEALRYTVKGGSGSGNYGHAGRPGKRGGSQPRGYSPGSPENSPSFKRWFGKSKVVDEEGNPLLLYHGTTHNFTEFSQTHANPENFLGEGFYFTNSKQDVSENYAGMGPDLTKRIETEAEKIFDAKYEDREPPKYGSKAYEKAYAKAREEARKRIAGENAGVVMPVYLKMENPLKILGDRDSTLFKIDYEMDEDGEYTGEESGNGLDLFESVKQAGWDYGFDGEEVWGEIFADFQWSDGISANEVDRALRESETLMYQEDDDGNLAGNKIIRDIYKGAGFDGVIVDAYKQFGPQKVAGTYTAGMPNVYRGDLHYVVWQTNQIKSFFNQGTFDPTSPNILKERLEDALKYVVKGGAGSGNWGHSGRPGKRGGSQAGNVKRLGSVIVGNTLKDIIGEIPRSEMGYAYMINKNGKLVSSTTEKTHGDIMGQAVSLDENLFGYDAGEKKRLSEAYAVRAYDVVSLGSQNAQFFHDAMRVRYLPVDKQIYVETARGDTKTLRRIQDYYTAGKFGKPLSFRWDCGDTQLYFNPTELLSTNGMSRDADGRYRFKGGPGSGNFSHAGRPGKRGGSAPAHGLPGIPDAIGPFEINVDTGILDGRGIPVDQKGINRDHFFREVDSGNKGLNEFLISHSGVDNDPRKTMEPGQADKVFGFLDDSSALLFFATDEARAQVKKDTAQELARRSGVPVEAIETIQEMWSSNANESAGAVSFHQAVAEELGSGLSDYQKNVREIPRANIDPQSRRLLKSYQEELTTTLEKDREYSQKVIDKITEKVTTGKLDSSFIKDNAKYWRELTEKSTMTDNDIKKKADILARARMEGKVPITDRASERKVVRAMYDWTQDELKKSGIKELTLYRGIGLQTKLKVGQPAQYKGNSAESWSTSMRVASQFTYGGMYKYILAARVPVKNVFCSSVTGLGCLPEAEFVIMPGQGAVVQVVYENKAAG